MRTSRWLLVAGIVVHAVLLASLVFGFLDPLFNDASYRQRAGDFYSVYQAGRDFLDGTDIYDAGRTTAVPFFYPYRYVPFVAATVGVAVQALPAGAAYVAWVAFLEGLLLLDIVLTRRMAADSARADVATALWLLFTPYYLELFMGQFSFFMITIVLWAIHAWQRSADVRGGVAWTLSVLTKSFSAVFAVPLLRLRRWRTVLAGSAAAALLTFPYFLLVPGSWAEFRADNFGGLSPFMIGGNQGVAALLAASAVRLTEVWPVLTGAPTSEYAALVQRAGSVYATPVLVLAVIAVGVAVAVTLRTRTRELGPLALFWVVTYFVFYTSVWEHQYVMLLPVFVLMYLSPSFFEGETAVPRPAFWVVFAVIAAPTLAVFLRPSFAVPDPEYTWGLAQSLAWHLPKAAAVLALWVLIARRLLAEPVTLAPMPALFGAKRTAAAPAPAKTRKRKR